MKSLETSCVVFGAGALGLGFIGPELSPNCRITYVDIAQKQDLLRHHPDKLADALCRIYAGLPPCGG